MTMKEKETTRSSMVQVNFTSSRSPISIRLLLLSLLSLSSLCFSDGFAFSTVRFYAKGQSPQEPVGIFLPQWHTTTSRTLPYLTNSNGPTLSSWKRQKSVSSLICMVKKDSSVLEASTTFGKNLDNDKERNRGILVLLTVPLAWGTFEPVVRFVYAMETPIPGLVFSPCYYFVAATALSTLSFVSASFSPSSSSSSSSSLLPTDNYNQETERKDDTPTSLPILGGMELGFYLFLGNSLQVLGLETLNADRVAFLIQLTTIFVPIVQGILLAGKQKNIFTVIPPRTWLACCIALLGVATIALEGNVNIAEMVENLWSGQHPLASSNSEGRTWNLGNLLTQGDYLVVGSALAYTFHCIRLEKYAKNTRAVTLAAAKATTEFILSVLLVAFLLFWYKYQPDSTGTVQDVTASNFLTRFATDTGRDIDVFFETVMTQWRLLSPPEGLLTPPPPSVDSVTTITASSALIPAVAATLWTGLVTCAYTIYAQSYGQSRVAPADANLIYTFQPVWTALIAYVWLGETLGPAEFVGGILIGYAVWLVTKTTRPVSDEAVE